MTGTVGEVVERNVRFERVFPLEQAAEERWLAELEVVKKIKADDIPGEVIK